MNGARSSSPTGQVRRYGPARPAPISSWPFLRCHGSHTRVDTWDRLQRKLGLEDFSPGNQDRAALELIDEAGALADVKAGRFPEAINKVRRIWASVPGAGYAQGERTLAWLTTRYTDAGGVLA